METSAANSPEKLPLDSIFAELRGLPPQPPRREMLAGLAWKSIFRAPTLFLLPFLLMFTLFPVAILGTILAQKSPKQKVSARVIQVEHFGQKQVFVKYRYMAKGKNYFGASVGMEPSPLQNLARGAALEISIEKTNPQNSAPAFETAAQENFPWPVLVFLPVMAACFFIPFFFPQVRTVFLARKLFTSGNLTTGRLKFIKSTAMHSPYNPYGSLEFVYDFNDAQGNSRRGTIKCDNSWLAQQLQPESPVIVAYNLKKPAQNVLLEPFVA